ncbi:ATP-binding protein [Mesorhizobium sp. Z1-4]|uniref:hybrid sensor histidine kinase/response regulator n=1 Tax=Mesorhizobium sp. Z1-4 TaxID=2448478 RepID=UPI001FE0748C|nr:ATP-binding protein [Mesorhizobium sp. Z1-4]
MLAELDLAGTAREPASGTPASSRVENTRNDPKHRLPVQMLPGAGTNTLDIAMQATLVAASVAAAGFSVYAGAPLLLQALAAAVGVLGAGTVARMRSMAARSQAVEANAQQREQREIEELADRLWELEESEERFRGLVDALGDIVVHRDREGRIVYANRVLAALLDRKVEELEGKTLAEVGIDIGVVMDAAFNDGEYLSSTDVAIRTKAGTRWYSWIELSVRDQTSEAVSHRAIARDITDRKRAELAANSARERAETASKAKSRFLATVSHEIRTPMNGIMGMAKLLRGTDLSPEQNTYVGAISTSASALLALIEDLLDFSKIEAGRLELELRLSSPRELAEHTVELLAARAFAKDIGLGCFVAPNVPATAMIDPGRFRQILLNLVGNAIKFTDTGGVLVEIAGSGSGSERTLTIRVKDTGPGLEKSDLKRIFEEFEQADGSPTRKHGGAGLGLAITSRIVEAMNGRIEVEGAPGKGATFTVTLPLEEASPASIEQGSALAGTRALVVSANAMEMDAIARMVEAFGGVVDTAKSIDEAIRLASEGNKYASILIDSALERPNCASLKSLRRLLPDGKAITLITPSDRGRLAELRGGGYAAFLPRPVRSDTLLRLLLQDSAGQAGRVVAGTGVELKAQPATGASVLIAEDNQINALLARSALTKAGHRVEVVPNGRAALQALTGSRQRFDVVLMDLNMPVMDGMDAIAGLRRHEETNGFPPIPVLVLSADSQDETRQSVLVRGANGFLTKPLDPADLVAAVEQHASA